MEPNEQIEVSPFVYSGLENILEENYEAALSDFDKSLELDGEDSIVLAYKARLLNKMDRNSEELEIWEKILKLKPDWKYAQMNKASSLMNIGENDQAISSYVKIAADDPKSPYYAHSVMNQAIAYHNLERYELAAEACELVEKLRKFDNDPQFWQTWADSLIPIVEDETNYLKLEDIIQEGLRNCPEDLRLTKSLCLALNWQKKFRESLTLCDKVLDKDPSDVATWLYKAYNLAELGDADKAYEAFFVAISIDRSDLKEGEREHPSEPFLKLNDDRFQKLIDRD